jgi:23S rRNA (adenine2503-C2)-methyltransferase
LNSSLAEKSAKRGPVIVLQETLPPVLAELTGIELPEARRIHAAVMRAESLDKPVRGVRRVSLERVRALCHMPRLEVAAAAASQEDPFQKWVLKAADGSSFETVRIPLEKPGRYSVCVSSQVGCAMACTFCATGRLGLARNLETWEIVEQVREVKASITEGRVHGVVFQGMGEPLANLDRVLGAIRILNEPAGLAIDARNMTVSTSGLPSGIRRLSREVPKVRLALSIGSALPEKRRSLMPISRSHSLDEVLDACREHARVTGLAPLWAVTPLAEQSDSEEEARQLGAMARAFWETTGIRPRISVIPYNAMGGDDPYQRPSPARLGAFEQGILETGYAPHRRYSGGADVGAACGQLVGLS